MNYLIQILWNDANHCDIKVNQINVYNSYYK